jgi:hypothetical protein
MNKKRAFWKAISLEPVFCTALHSHPLRRLRFADGAGQHMNNHFDEFTATAPPALSASCNLCGWYMRRLPFAICTVFQGQCMTKEGVQYKCCNHPWLGSAYFHCAFTCTIDQMRSGTDNLKGVRADWGLLTLCNCLII